jgi:hypothetical protein
MPMDEDVMRERWLTSIPPEFCPQRGAGPKKLPTLRCIDCQKAFEKRSHARRCKTCQSHFDRMVHQRYQPLKGD